MATGTAVETGLDTVTQLQILPGGLDHYLAMVGDGGGNPRLKCYDGSILLVSPGIPHETATIRIDRLIDSVATILRIPYCAFASTFYRIPGEDKGIEPDKSYYVQNYATARKIKNDNDLANSPPPDLIVEVVDTNGPSRSLAFCRELGVPEVWVYYVKSQRLSMLRLRNTGKKSAKYEESATSLAFPFLIPEMVVPWLIADVPDFGAFSRKLRKWVRAELAPRFNEGRKRP